MGKKIVPKTAGEEVSAVLYTKPACKGAAETTLLKARDNG